MAEEPKLKYSKFTTNLKQILSQDAISCLAVSKRFLGLGTHSGMIHLMDMIGTPVREWKAHTASINQLSIDDNEEYFASASQDGTVVICSLYSSDQQTYQYKRPVLGVQLEPGYAKSTNRQFLYGGAGETLLLCGKGWFGTSTTTLDQGQGPISSIQWRKTYIAWVNDKGLFVYDLATSTKLGHIERSQDELNRCNIVFNSDNEFMYSWGDVVKLVRICERSQMDISSGLSAKYLEVVHEFRTDFIVSGLAPFQGNIMLLAFITDSEESVSPTTGKKKNNPPEIFIVDLDGNEIANDVLTIPGYELFLASDYRLEYLPGETESENSYYIISPKDIVLGKPRDIMDHVSWLVDCQEYASALEIVEKSESYSDRERMDSITAIGLKYLDHLFAKKDFQSAALLCPKILRSDKDAWETWIYKFADNRAIKAIYALVPTNPILSHTVYEMILSEFLNTDLTIFLEIVQTWPWTVYSVETMIRAVESQLHHSENVALVYSILIELCLRAQQYEKATYYGMLKREPGQIEMIQTHNLIDFLKKNVALVMEYQMDTFPKPTIENTNVVDRIQLVRDMKSSLAVRLLIQHSDHIPVLITNSAKESSSRP